ncbi:DUF6443 domain-containing protein [Chitinophaga rhizosphaerae]|uniref:DUF6443 domain-containing protein n=1 Tax=Chitinophaga rhizosphaerae TaxID=1864947 RepID=UPI000F80849D|nr:DUF6443 domain-containing protein [Chitinophaga rhizosphaerae]
MQKSFSKYLLAIGFVLLDVAANAQQPLPAPYASGSQVNYIRTWQTKAPISDPATIKTAGLREVKMTTIYVDGLGREIQTVVRKGSLPTGDTARDLVKGTVYDSEGRQSIEYLPFSASNAGGNNSISDGGFKKNPFNQQTGYFNARLTGQAGETNVGASSLTWAYNQTSYDGSPMDRVVKSLPAGASWVGSGRGTSSAYWVNTLTDSVRIWQVTDVVGSWGTYATSGIYPAGTLLKNVTTDEHGRQSIQYQDKAGRLILAKRQQTATADAGNGSGHAGWVCNYYVYDDLDRLRLIIQPEGLNLLMANGWNTTALSGAILAEQCYRYEYDGRGLVIRQKHPGIAEVYKVYDKRGRQVLEQDGNLRAGSPVKWQYTQYDSLNRVTATGLWNSSQSLATHKSAAEATNNYPVMTAGTYEELAIKRYDNYDNIPSGFFSQFTGTYLFYNTNMNYGTSPEYAESIDQTLNAAGKLTWEGRKILGSSQFVYTAYYYDNKGRLIQDRSSDGNGGYTFVTRQYNFSGQVIRTVSRHDKAGTNPNTVLVITKSTYDDLGRILSLGQTTTSGGAFKTMAAFQYDAQGKLSSKSMGTHPVSGQPLERQDYAYNVRGWLLGVNQAFTHDTVDQSRYFGYQLAYDGDGPVLYGAANPLTQKRYDGGIARMMWKSAGDQKIRKYDLTYDNLNQLMGADFSQLKGGAFGKTDLDFSASGLSYDANGNLQKMTQRGWKGSGNATIDSLVYTYIANSNRLKNVIDQANDTATLIGDFRTSKSYMTSLGGTKTTSATDYAYDDNGNMSKDMNKDIGTIRYNHLNLVEWVHFPGKGAVSYTYAADGKRLSKKVVDSTQSPVLTTTTNYIENFVYESSQHSTAQPGDYIDKFLFFMGQEGRTRLISAGVFKDDYFIKDHVGNVRMVLTDEQLTDAYPTLSWEGTAGSAQVNNQNAYWENRTGGSIDVTTTRVARPGAFGDTTANGQQVMLVRRSTGAIGAAKLLKVMKGDRLHAYVEYYFQVANANNTPANGIGSLLANLGAALAGSSNFADFLKPGATSLASGLSGNAALAGLLNTNPATSGANQAPKAYLNVLIFDEQLRFDASASRVFPVSYTPGVKYTIDRRLANAIDVTRNGYAYVYISNESDELVYFDNFNLSHEHSPLVEETHYYPFGLPIAAISSKTLGKLPNNYAFNGMEKQSRELGAKTGLEWHDFGARMFDHQIGRWLCPDPSAGKYEWTSSYAFSFNNPMQVIDPTGKDGIVTGSGSQDDPYVVTANYYFYGMTDDQAAAFQASIAAYNNDGKAFAVKTDNGTVYVKFNLTATKTENREEAKEKAGNDVLKIGSLQIGFGNTVTVGNIDNKKDAYGASTNRDITLNEQKMAAAAEQYPGVDLNALRTSTGIHEIGHNLGGVHGDPGSIMSDATFSEVPRNAGVSNSGSGQYRLFSSAVDIGGIRAIAGRFDTPLGTIASKYITPTEREKLKETSRIGNVKKVTKEDLEN